MSNTNLNFENGNLTGWDSWNANTHSTVQVLAAAAKTGSYGARITMEGNPDDGSGVTSQNSYVLDLASAVQFEMWLRINSVNNPNAGSYNFSLSITMFPCDSGGNETYEADNKLYRQYNVKHTHDWIKVQISLDDMRARWGVGTPDYAKLIVRTDINGQQATTVGFVTDIADLAVTTTGVGSRTINLDFAGADPITLDHAYQWQGSTTFPTEGNLPAGGSQFFRQYAHGDGAGTEDTLELPGNLRSITGWYRIPIHEHVNVTSTHQTIIREYQYSQDEAWDTLTDSAAYPSSEWRIYQWFVPTGHTDPLNTLRFDTMAFDGDEIEVDWSHIVLTYDYNVPVNKSASDTVSVTADGYGGLKFTTTDSLSVQAADATAYNGDNLSFETRSLANWEPYCPNAASHFITAESAGHTAGKWGGRLSIRGDPNGNSNNASGRFSVDLTGARTFEMWVRVTNFVAPQAGGEYQIEARITNAIWNNGAQKWIPSGGHILIYAEPVLCDHDWIKIQVSDYELQTAFGYSPISMGCLDIVAYLYGAESDTIGFDFDFADLACVIDGPVTRTVKLNFVPTEFGGTDPIAFTFPTTANDAETGLDESDYDAPGGDPFAYRQYANGAAANAHAHLILPNKLRSITFWYKVPQYTVAFGDADAAINLHTSNGLEPLWSTNAANAPFGDNPALLPRSVWKMTQCRHDGLTATGESNWLEFTTHTNSGNTIAAYFDHMTITFDYEMYAKAGAESFPILITDSGATWKCEPADEFSAGLLLIPGFGSVEMLELQAGVLTGPGMVTDLITDLGTKGVTMSAAEIDAKAFVNAVSSTGMTTWGNGKRTLLCKFTRGDEPFIIGYKLTGQISGAYGTISWYQKTSGSWGLNTAKGYVQIKNIVGKFKKNEKLIMGP